MKINDGEIYESLRISTIFSGHTFVTTGEQPTWNDRHDNQFFEANPRRKFLLRISNSAEFDAPLYVGESVNVPCGRLVPPVSKALESIYEHIPPLWTLVSRMYPKRHVLTAVYRGSAYFQTAQHSGRTIADCGDDHNVAVLLQTMTMRRGLDGEEWLAFERLYRQTVSHFSTRTNATRVQ